MMTKMKKSLKRNVALAATMLSIVVAIFIIVKQTEHFRDEESTDPRNGVYYEIFVRSFYDSDGDGIGDFNGITQKLDYLNDGNDDTNDDLGIDGIWLMPINPSPSYHGYDVTDYYNVNSEYGTIEDFKNLLDEAEKRGIKVIIDLVVNHTSSQHEWFIDANSSSSSKYRDWYIWTKDENQASEQGALNGVGWHQGNEGYYIGTFWDQMPDLNFANTEVQNQIGEIGKYWLEMGVDGFRLDAAKHIFIDLQKHTNDTTAKNNNIKMWQKFRQDMNEVNKNAFLVGEIWDSSSAIAPYLNKALDSAFNFDLGEMILSTVKQKTTSNFADFLNGVYLEYDVEAKGQYVDTTFLTNHDQNRVMSELNGELEQAKLCASILLTLPGTPFLYYGEELGMVGSKPDENIRLPFPWYTDGKGVGQTSWREYEDLSIINRQQSYEAQKLDKKSLLKHYIQLIKLRKENEALSSGMIEAYPNEIFESEIYVRSTDKQRLLVIHNLDNKEHTFSLENLEKNELFKKVIYESKTGSKIVNNKITIPAETSVIIEK
jgi:glycosidase